MEFNFVYQNSRVIAMESKPMPQVSSMNAVTEISCCWLKLSISYMNIIITSTSTNVT